MVARASCYDYEFQDHLKYNLAYLVFHCTEKQYPQNIEFKGL